MDKQGKKGGRSRPQAVVVERPCWQPAEGGAELGRALREDLRELLGSLPVLLEGAQVKDGAALASLLARAQAPLLAVFEDVAGLPLLCAEGALDSLRELPVVVGPCADGSLYALGVAQGLEPALVAELCDAACGAGALGAVTDLLADAELECTVLPPWFRVAGEGDLLFAENLARLSLLSEGGEEDFIADRLRVWLERHRAGAAEGRP
ncbi:MAG: hypothetical protein IT463_13575 [Planctomycetes bacterium]|nr:hypothetical protein [Planctomycetota bacterium]